MTQEQFKDVENVLMGIITNAAFTIEDVVGAVNALRDFELVQSQIVNEYPRKKVGDECGGERGSKDVPAPGGCVVSQYCNNVLIHKLINEFKTGELVNPLAKESVVVSALQSGINYACTGLAKDPTLLEAAIVADHYIALICGGNNGNGTWSVYLDQISSIIYSLEEQSYKAWLIRLDNDCPDDVWYAYIGLSSREDI